MAIMAIFVNHEGHGKMLRQRRWTPAFAGVANGRGGMIRGNGWAWLIVGRQKANQLQADSRQLTGKAESPAVAGQTDENVCPTGRLSVGWEFHLFYP